ncbi:hypothetical protein A9168_09020 [Macellibacteroides sp. HH-ZS]|nr:hypothetical protein A9168_09020 [Macellibacteroides sp. HH-ZS]
MCSQDGIAETLTLKYAEGAWGLCWSCFSGGRLLFCIAQGVRGECGEMTDEGSMTDEFWHLSFYNFMLFSVLNSKNEG